MNSAWIGGDRRGSFRWRPTSMMLTERVPAGTKSGRPSRAGVFGNANPARGGGERHGARAAGGLHERHHADIRPRDGGAPRDVQRGGLGVHAPGRRRGAEGGDAILGADAAAEGTAIEQAGAEPGEEPE